MAHKLVRIPTFNPVNPEHPMAAEWATFVKGTNSADGLLRTGFAIMNPDHQHPTLPAAFLAAPATPTAQLAAAIVTITHLNGLLVQFMEAQQQFMVAQHTATLNLAQQVEVLPAPAPVPQPPIRIKTAPPKEFNGKAYGANNFLAECNNYFAFYSMTEEQKIRAALQLTKKGALTWKTDQLELISQPVPPPHFATWAAFQAEFRLRFVDSREREKAAWNLNKGKVVQTTSAKLFIDKIQVQCDKAGYTSDIHRMDLIRSGLKPYLAKAIAPVVTATPQEFIQMVITTDENLQLLRERERLKKTTTSPRYSV
jgi:hypothetical protein